MKPLIKTSAFIILCSIFNIANAQAPEIEWQKAIGGTGADLLKFSCIASNGDYVFAGSSNSGISGLKSQASYGDYDYWIVRTDTNGIILWDKTVGGSNSDHVYCVNATSDNGVIVGGYSYSNASGLKTENSIGSNDYWVVKLDETGNVEWENTIGGNEGEYLEVVFETSDGGYFVAGRSESDISGDKTEDAMSNFLSTYDYWVVKLNSSGDVEWDETIGSNYNDILRGALQTTDGGYVIAGYTVGEGQDKIEDNYGDEDFWILKLDASGNIVWQNSIGGSKSDLCTGIEQVGTTGYLVYGYSGSDISFDKDAVSYGGHDYWVIMLDITGNIVWQKTIGGFGIDYLEHVCLTNDAGFLLGGRSVSNISGVKSENAIGQFDFWLVRIDSTGNILWDKTLGGTLDEVLYNFHFTNGRYLIPGYSSSGISGNKTEASFGSYDYWILKFEADCTPIAELCNTLDDNCNGLIDDGIVETISISAGGPTTFCQGGSVVLTATHSGTTLQWKKDGVNIPGATNVTYTVTKKATYTCVTTSPCGTATSTGILVNVQKNPPANITAGGPTSFCMGGSVVLTANAGAGLSYQWYKGATPLAGATLINYTATLPGNYKCRVTKTATGCFKNSNAIMVTVPCKQGDSIHHSLPIAIGITTHSFTLHPNPATDKLTITIHSLFTPHSSLLITDLSGRTIEQHSITSSTTELDVSNYAAGMYLVKIEIDGEEQIQKFIKQ